MNARAVLVSPVYEAQVSEGCLRLAVHMFGADVGSLEITQFPESDDSSVAVLAKFSGAQSNNWTIKQGRLFLTHKETQLLSTFQIIYYFYRDT